MAFFTRPSTIAISHQPSAMTEPHHDELEALMCEYLAGRIEAFDGLYAALGTRLRAYLLSLCRDSSVADDLLQETFLQMHRSRRTYQPGRPVAPWVFAIARHVFLMHRRGSARRVRFLERVAAAVGADDMMRDDRRALADVDAVRRALRAVPADQRRALVLHHVEGWSFAEIADRLGIRLNAAKTRAFRGMRRMREQLK
ncbi:MAG: RNA polymerase sigma factor [Acidobacteria bacterium]|nr:MAG: RNA polymerase sigma factor [Acidobacteriota bacterium]